MGQIVSLQKLHFTAKKKQRVYVREPLSHFPVFISSVSSTLLLVPHRIPLGHLVLVSYPRSPCNVGTRLKPVSLEFSCFDRSIGLLYTDSSKMFVRDHLLKIKDLSKSNVSVQNACSATLGTILFDLLSNVFFAVRLYCLYVRMCSLMERYS